MQISETARGKHMNILMIEDDRELCSAVSFRLEQEGFSVTLCHDGEEGL